MLYLTPPPKKHRYVHQYRRIQDRRRELDSRLAAVRKQQEQDKANLSRVRGMIRHGSGGGSNGKGGVTRDGRKWSARTSFPTSNGGGSGRKRPRPQQPSSFAENHGKGSSSATATAGRRGKASSGGGDGASGEGTTDSAGEGEGAGAGDDEFLVAEYDSGKEGGSGGGGGGDGGRESSDEEGNAGCVERGDEEEEEEWADLGLRQVCVCRCVGRGWLSW